MKKIKHSTTFSFHREKTDTKTELLLSLTTSSTSKSTFDSSNMSAIPKIGKQLISFILTNYNKILPFCSTIQDSLLIDLVIFLRDPLTSQAHEPDIQALIRLCDVYCVPVATNLASAEIFIKALDRGEFSFREVRKTKSQRI